MLKPRISPFGAGAVGGTVAPIAITPGADAGGTLFPGRASLASAGRRG